MKFHLKIDCDNAAFDGTEREEVARILRWAAGKVLLNPPDYIGEHFPLFDINGNRVGEAYFTEKGD